MAVKTRYFVLSIAMLCTAALSACSGMRARRLDGQSSSIQSDGGKVVSVSGGKVAYASDSTTAERVFKAIPFAAPPVGQLRWKAPQPVAAWSGVRRSEDFSPACLQGNRPFGKPGSILYQGELPQSEDCLYLNVWAGAASTEKRPVLLLLHGGGFLLGGGSQPNYNGASLAAKGAIVVTMNYRLGPLGFLAHPALSAESPHKVSGNYAVLDAIAALQWVQTNIGAFGGDATHVTLLSESAGSGIASVLLGSPAAKGLFQRVVISSLGSMPTDREAPPLALAEKVGAKYAAELGASDAAALRALPADKLMATPGSIPVPVVDGVIWPDQLDKLFATGAVADVPMLVGWNADEATPYPPFATDLASYNEAAAKRFGPMADAFKQVYPVSSDSDVKAMGRLPFRDSFFAWQPWATARAHAALKKSPTWLYFFTRRPAYNPGQKFNEQDPPEQYGAHHSLEQVYFYNNLAKSAPPRAFNETDQRIADAASSYLIRFAETGNPNQNGLPAWPRFEGAGSQSMEIGDRIAPAAVPFQPALQFFDQFHAERIGRKLPF